MSQFWMGLFRMYVNSTFIFQWCVWFDFLKVSPYFELGVEVLVYLFGERRMERRSLLLVGSMDAKALVMESISKLFSRLFAVAYPFPTLFQWIFLVIYRKNFVDETIIGIRVFICEKELFISLFSKS